MSETRIVLVKPGDVLILGNVGEFAASDAKTIAHHLEVLKRRLGLREVLLFEGDIELAMVEGGA